MASLLAALQAGCLYLWHEWQRLATVAETGTLQTAQWLQDGHTLHETQTAKLQRLHLFGCLLLLQRPRLSTRKSSHLRINGHARAHDACITAPPVGGPYLPEQRSQQDVVC